MSFNQKYIISVAIIGRVSAGKSTVLNALFSREITQTRMKRCTLRPFVFNVDDVNNISQHNDLLPRVNKTTSDEFNLTIPIPSWGKKLHNIRYKFYDIPGIDDSSDSALFINYIKKSAHKFDIILLVLDVNNGINTIADVDIIKTVMNLRNNKLNQPIHVLINKVDHEFDDEILELIHEIKTHMKKYKPTTITAISAETSFMKKCFQLWAKFIFLHARSSLNPSVWFLGT